MSRMKDLHVEDHEDVIAEVVYRIYLDDDGADNPRKWDNLGTLVSLDSCREPAHRTDKGASLSYDGCKAIEARFAPQLAKLRETAELFEDGEDGPNVIVAADLALFELALANVNILRAELRCFGVAGSLSSILADAARNLRDLVQLPVGFAFDCLVPEAIEADLNNAISALYEGVYDFSNCDDAELFFSDIASELGWAWIDCGSHGWLYATAEKLAAEYKGVAPDAAWLGGKSVAEKATECLECEWRTYRNWRDGEVYGWIAVPSVNFDPECHPGESLESCWGYYGLDDIRQRVEEAIKTHEVQAETSWEVDNIRIGAEKRADTVTLITQGNGPINKEV